MLVTPESNRRNFRLALTITGIVSATTAIVGWFVPWALLCLGVCPLAYWLIRRRCLRRLTIARQPFPASWEHVLQTHVAYFRALPPPAQERFRQLVAVFLDEVRITGIRTEVDDTVRVLVAASAVIPIFGFQDWEYHRLGEVLIYPNSFGKEFETTGIADRNILGMVGLRHLGGIMILSKESLLDGFDDPSNIDNVGVHEFVHLVEQEEADHGLPPEVPWRAVQHWLKYVGQELAHRPKNSSYISDYAFTNEHEFLAVLAEYFFKSPDVLQKKDPQLYAMLREMFHQDTDSFLPRPLLGRHQYGRNLPCPCGSGKKYKHCCLLNATSSCTTEAGAKE